MRDHIMQAAKFEEAVNYIKSESKLLKFIKSRNDENGKMYAQFAYIVFDPVNKQWVADKNEQAILIVSPDLSSKVMIWNKAKGEKKVYCEGKQPWYAVRRLVECNPAAKFIDE